MFSFLPNHLLLVKVVDVDLTFCVSGGEPFAVLTGTQQVHWLSGAWTSHTKAVNTLTNGVIRYVTVSCCVDQYTFHRALWDLDMWEKDSTLSS